MTARTGILLIVSGPSGSGKTTLCRRLAESGEVHYSISCTTRLPRAGEENGRDYHFLTQEDFSSRLTAGDFLEHATVHGNLYGSLRSEVISYLRAGTDVVMDIDVQGAEQVRDCTDHEIQRAFTDLFVMPPSEEELLHRLAGRGTDHADVIALRMTNATLAALPLLPRFCQSGGGLRKISSTRDGRAAPGLKNFVTCVLALATTQKSV
jgi:guanylate kinase